MSQAEELLDSLPTDGEAAQYLLSSLSSNEEVEEHIVIGNDRVITVPSSLKKIAVQYDHNVRTVTFDCPRYCDGRDLSTMIITVNYVRPDGELGMYLVDSVTFDETDNTVMHFDWVIKSHVTDASGNLSFLVCAKKLNDDGTSENHWNTEINQEMTISKGLECSEVIAGEYPDLITRILTRLHTVEANYQKKTKATAISLPISGWSGSGLLYSQIASVPNVTENSRVELFPSPAQLQELLASEISLTVANESGTVTVFAIGGKPISDYTIQIIISEVDII